MKRRKRDVRNYTIDEPNIIECHYTFGGFNLIFKSSHYEEDGTETVRTVRIILHFCDLSELAKKLWGCIKDRQTKINLISAAMKGE